MKKVILIVALALISAGTFAQDKVTNTHVQHADVVNVGSRIDDGVTTSIKDVVTPTAKKDTAAKPEFKVDPERVYIVQLQLTAKAIDALTLSPDEWNTLDNSKVSAGDVTNHKNLAKYVRSLIKQEQQYQVEQDYKAFLIKTGQLKPDAVGNKKGGKKAGS